MRRAEPLEPDTAAALAAIDATLAGESVDPEHAELAELALILRDERPVPDLATIAALDERVAAFSAERARPARRWPLWLGAPVATAAAVALVIVVAGSGGSGSLVNDVALPGHGTVSVASSAASSAGSADSSGAGGSSSTAAAPTERAPSASAGAAQSAPAGAAPSPSPSGSGKRQVVQSAQLTLSAPARKLDDVAQQVFDVVDAQQGIVASSHVTSTGGPDGSARFELSIPVGHLQRTVSALSQLQGAHVLSRTDDSNDITGQVGGAGRHLAEARALRRSLLHQLAAATTPEAIASLKAQLRDADGAIARDASTLNGLHRQVDYSSLTVTIQASSEPIAPAGHGHGFTLHRALHDAGRVLVVVAGVALIALAVIVPLALVVALVLWLGTIQRRRRREAMLDLM